MTMRRLALALGVATMTLYTYIPGKAELVDLLLDAAYLRMCRIDTAGQPRRERLIAVAEENRALYGAHPWAAEDSSNAMENLARAPRRCHRLRPSWLGLLRCSRWGWSGE